MAKPLYSVTIDRRKADQKLKQIRDAAGRFMPQTLLVIEQFAQTSTALIKTVTPRATGTLANSTDYTISRSHNRFLVSIQQPVFSYSGIPISLLRGYGRGPGTPPPILAIQSWMVAAGVTPRQGQTLKQAARNISYVIGRRGTVQFYEELPAYWELVTPQIEHAANLVAGKIGTNLRLAFGEGATGKARNINSYEDEEGDIY